MSDLAKLEELKSLERKTLSDDELKKRLGGAPFQPGESIVLSQIDYALKKVVVGVGWDVPGVDTGGIDVDCSVFILDKNDKTREDSDFVFYNNLSGGDNDAVMHLGDNRTGDGDGDDEQIAIDLQALSFDVLKLVFVISIYDYEMREQNLTMLRNLYIRLVNPDTQLELLRFPIDETTADKYSAAMIAGELVREGPSWLFTARGTFLPGGLGPIATSYGMMVTG
jgi:tellurium resistance protein TerD